MYVCRKPWKGLLLHTKLWDKLETSRFSLYQRILGPVFLFLLSPGKTRTLACFLLFKRRACSSCPWCARLPTFCSLRHPEFFLYESFARNQWIRWTKPHLIKNATQSPKMGPVQRRVGRIGVYAASIISGLMWTRHFHLREQRLRKFIGTKIK